MCVRDCLVYSVTVVEVGVRHTICVCVRDCLVYSVTVVEVGVRHTICVCVRDCLVYSVTVVEVGVRHNVYWRITGTVGVYRCRGIKISVGLQGLSEPWKQPFPSKLISINMSSNILCVEIRYDRGNGGVCC